MNRIMGYDYSIFLIGEQHKNQSEILFPFTEACGGGSRETVFFCQAKCRYNRPKRFSIIKVKFICYFMVLFIIVSIFIHFYCQYTMRLLMECNNIIILNLIIFI
jgi:hypothetical protein